MTLLGPDGQRTPLTVWLRWRSDDPWAVAVTFGTSADATCWLIGLELLVAGCVGPAGLGDVSLLPAPPEPGQPGASGEHGVLGGLGGPVAAYTELILSSPTGQACLRLRTADLAGVLDRFLRGRDVLDAGLLVDPYTVPYTDPCDPCGGDPVDVEFAQLLADDHADERGRGDDRGDHR